MRLISKFGLLFATLASSAFAIADDTYNGPKDGAIGFQEPATPVMEEIIKFHDGFIFPLIVVITVFVMALMGFIMWRFSEKRNPVPSKTTHHVGLEVAWTIVPIVVLLFMVGPSMRLLYLQDRLPETEMTIKVVGNTWFWSYEYPDHADKVDAFDSLLLEKEDAEAAGKPYLLAADTPLVVPVNTKIKVLVTSNNNLHSFAVPAFGVKMDAVPGRLNETWFEVLREGTFYGQCSELCGVRHAYMPIEVKVVSKTAFNQWVANGGTFATRSAQAISADITATPK